MANMGSKYPLPITSSVGQSVSSPVAVATTGAGLLEPQAPIIDSVTISGDTRVGDVLSSTIVYTTAPVPSGTPSYQWQRDAVNIAGATGSSYTLTADDAGTAITLVFSITNSEGSDGPDTSNTINADALSAPSITGVPTISGTAYEGNVLTATAASPVTGNPPPDTTWQWERDGTPISGATSQTYTLVSADGNADITVVQTETNSQGSDTAESAASTIEAAPVISGVPTISGSESVGSTLTATAASVTGTPTPTRTWQWQRSADGSTGWADISGATSATYTLVSADEDEYVRAVQTETNANGTDSAASAASGQIAGGLPLDTVTSAVLAFSTARKLRTAYTGDAIRVRRSSDDAEQDIGFDGSGNLDESALTTFVGANDGYVVTVYEQSGAAGAVDYAQSTAALQPVIVSSGVVVKKNGYPAMQRTISGAGAEFVTLTAWNTRPSTAYGCDVWSLPSGASATFWSASSLSVFSGAVDGTTSTLLSRNAGSGLTWYRNGALVATDGVTQRTALRSATCDDALGIVRTHGADLSNVDWSLLRTEYSINGAFDGPEYMAEQIIITDSAQIAALEANQATFYGITLA